MLVRFSKFILFVYSLLIAALFFISLIAFYDDLGWVKSVAIFLCSMVFIVNSLSVFFIQSKPYILILPMVCFAGYGIFEVFYVGSGIYNDTDNSVHIIHWGILLLLRAIIPIAISFGCYLTLKRANLFTRSPKSNLE